MRNHKPGWWVLLIVALLMFGALIGVTRLGLAEWETEAAEFVILLLAFSLMLVWVRANEGRIERYEFQHDQERQARLRRGARS